MGGCPPARTETICPFLRRLITFHWKLERNKCYEGKLIFSNNECELNFFPRYTQVTAKT
jgi:hypothetical protein